MLLHSIEREIIKDPPKKIFRGFDVLKSNNDGLTQLTKMFEKGKISSHVGLIEEQEFDFKRLERMYGKNCLNYLKSFYQYSLDNYMTMFRKSKLEITDITKTLKFHHELMLPTPLVSTSSSLVTAIRYSHWFLMPVLVFSTNDLEAVDFGADSADFEIGIFKELPCKNISDIIYFYESPSKLKELLQEYGREDIKLHKGFTNSEFEYLDTEGNMQFYVPFNLKYDKEFSNFYKFKEKEIISIKTK